MFNIVSKFWGYYQLGGGNKWSTLEHNGVMFPPAYVPHGIPIKYNGNIIHLSPLAEEYATIYAKYLDTDYAKSKIFRDNFWRDWKKILDKNGEIKNLEGCDFSAIVKYIKKSNEKKKEMSKEEKNRQKKLREKDEEKYKLVKIDGKEQPIGNYKIEPPGIFLGRGKHPKSGCIKWRIYPEDVTINIGKEAKITAPEGHKWKSVIHDKTVEWLASWKDSISGKTKYVWLGSQSDMKANSDKEKFEVARKLKKKIKSIREINCKNLVNPDKKLRQIATAVYFIDNLALRVGNEKSEDEADTVGVVSLRVEHINIDEKGNLTLNFLGKDSVRYTNTITPSEAVCTNIKDFTKNKTEGEKIFDLINVTDVNNYLHGFMKDLTAKVFRTFNASYLLQKELSKISSDYDGYDKSDKKERLIIEFNRANAKVAILCNHQKNISKSHDDQTKKLKENIKKLKEKIKDANSEQKQVINNKIQKLSIKKKLRDELKNISLGTSKTSYIDPRITISFLKKHDISLDKVFSKTLQQKFKWAFEVGEDFVF